MVAVQDGTAALESNELPISGITQEKVERLPSAVLQGMPASIGGGGRPDNPDDLTTLKAGKC